ncbi:hypothetical protein JTE90_019149 [Oedothorax gibbosus]|uniref:Uncharacterized protein n=1 Tax=Oedothorax gibbosus TaxID=931172 RepID=A0AAV6UUR3_9ARAC|nr:hypothetical protein JTE90_019149 [Oedothorax gibbosus]
MIDLYSYDANVSCEIVISILRDSQRRTEDFVNGAVANITRSDVTTNWRKFEQSRRPSSTQICVRVFDRSEFVFEKKEKHISRHISILFRSRFIKKILLGSRICLLFFKKRQSSALEKVVYCCFNQSNLDQIVYWETPL